MTMDPSGQTGTSAGPGLGSVQVDPRKVIHDIEVAVLVRGKQDHG